MDREWIVKHSTLNKQEDIIYLITEYCKDTERTDEDIKTILQTCMMLPQLLVSAINNIQDYYYKKYNICILKDNQNNIIKLF